MGRRWPTPGWPASTNDSAGSASLSAIAGREAVGHAANPRSRQNSCHATVVQVLHWSALAHGYFFSSLPYLCSHIASEGLKILEKYLPLPQVLEHPSNICRKPSCTPETDAVKTMQNTQDAFAETLYKNLHNVALRIYRDGDLVTL